MNLCESKPNREREREGDWTRERERERERRVINENKTLKNFFRSGSKGQNTKKETKIGPFSSIKRDRKVISLTMLFRQPPYLCGIVCAYHHAAVGSSPKHTIYAFSIYIIEIVMSKGQK